MGVLYYELLMSGEIQSVSAAIEKKSWGEVDNPICCITTLIHMLLYRQPIPKTNECNGAELGGNSFSYVFTQPLHY